MTHLHFFKSHQTPSLYVCSSFHQVKLHDSSSKEIVFYVVIKIKVVEKATYRCKLFHKIHQYVTTIIPLFKWTQ